MSRAPTITAAHRRTLTLLALTLMAGGAALMAWAAGWRKAGDAFSPLHPGWIALVVGAVPIALGGYVVAYRQFAKVDGGPSLGWRAAAATVAAGFGPFTAAGGMAVDHRVLRGLGGSRRDAQRFVLGLGALEYGVLAPAACACAIGELGAGARGIQGALVWSWAVAVPVGFAIGLWAAAPDRRERVSTRHRPGRWLRSGLEGVGLLRELVMRPWRHRGAWLGMTLHWAAEIAALYGALRLFGTHLSVARTVLAYATGYALTRRTMPLAGAGATQILMTLAVNWVGAPLAAALPPVLVYRAATLILPAPAAFGAHRQLEPVIARGVTGGRGQPG